jgi:drug/metabolite transporter (DMT)-like permease
MNYLIGVTLLWSFSFSLIGVYLAGQVDAYFSVLTRIVLASLVFLPFQPSLAAPRSGGQADGPRCHPARHHVSLLLPLLPALTVPEVLVFTIFTPIYVTLIHDLLEGRFKPVYLWGALLAVLGAAVIRFDGLTENYVLGFLVVQGANVCFALGQVGYKVLLAREAEQPPQLAVFGCFYLGALVIALPAWWLLGKPQYPASSLQWGILFWLGVGASGLGYFLWNKGRPWSAAACWPS